MDDFQIQPDVIVVVPTTAQLQLHMNFYQCGIFRE